MALTLWRVVALAAATVAATVAAAGCTKKGAAPAELVVYSGRNEALLGPVLERFEQQTGIDVKVRYGETPGLAALLLEEGDRTPADVYVAQDAGALGLLEKARRFLPLPDALLAKVARDDFRSSGGTWIGLSGRLRVLAFDIRAVSLEALPASVLELTGEKWKGKLGWAPTNASFQAFVTALRLAKGEDVARDWLRRMKANAPRSYKNNTAIIEALARGEVQVGLVNHYYLHAMAQDRREPLPVRNHHFAPDDPGALVNVAGAGILRSSKRQDAALRLLEYLVGPEAQAHFARETFEYPVVSGVPPHGDLPPLGEGHPGLDLSRLEDLRGTLDLLQAEGVL